MKKGMALALSLALTTGALAAPPTKHTRGHHEEHEEKGA